MYPYIYIHWYVCMYIYIGPHAIHGPQYNHPIASLRNCDGWHLGTFRNLAATLEASWAQNSQFFASCSKARARGDGGSEKTGEFEIQASIWLLTK